jgi:hypothetical protein
MFSGHILKMMRYLIYFMIRANYNNRSIHEYKIIVYKNISEIFVHNV